MTCKPIPMVRSLATIGLMGVSSIAFAQGSDLFPTNKGAHWDYKGSVGPTALEMSALITSSKKEGAATVITVQWTQNGNVVQVETYNVTATGVTRSKAGKDGTITSTPPVPIIRFPMAVGKSWSWQGELDVQGTK